MFERAATNAPGTVMAPGAVKLAVNYESSLFRSVVLMVLLLMTALCVQPTSIVFGPSSFRMLVLTTLTALVPSGMRMARQL